MNKNKIHIIAFLTILLLSTYALAGGPAIEDFLLSRSEDKLLVSFRVAGAFTDEIRDRIESGLEVNFRHMIKMVDPRWYWWNKDVLKKEVRTGVKYDNLTKQYNLTMEIDGGVIESEATSEFKDVARWMTHLENITLGSVESLESGEKYVVKAKTDVMNRSILFFIPWDMDTDWKKIPFSMQ